MASALSTVIFSDSSLIDVLDSVEFATSDSEEVVVSVAFDPVVEFCVVESDVSVVISF